MFRRRHEPSTDEASIAAARLTAALRLAPIWIFEQDASLRYTWLQNADTQGDAGGGTDADLMERPDEAADVIAIKQRVLERGQAETVELIAHVGGEPRRHRMHVEPMLGPGDEVVGVRGSTLDLGPATDQTHSASTALIRLVGHELRNAVNPVRMTVQLERRRAAAGSVQSAGLANAYAGVERLTALLEDMLDYTRSATEALPMTLGAVELEAAITQAASRFLVVHPEAEDRFAAAPPPRGCRVRADPDRVQQLLLALLDRAARTTDKDKRITLSAVSDDDFAHIEVVDDGAGVPSEARGHHEDPLAWARVCVAEQRDEPPFALALVARLARGMGGDLDVTSGPHGEGTRATVRLPLHAAAPAPQRAAPAPGPIAPLRILLVDDSPGATHTLRLLLEGDGHYIEEAQTGAQCLERAAATDFDVVLLDIGLPDIGGYDVARRIRGAPGPQPVLLGLTGRSTDADRRASAEAGFDQHLVKPVDLARLREALAEVPGTDRA